MAEEVVPGSNSDSPLAQPDAFHLVQSHMVYHYLGQEQLISTLPLMAVNQYILTLTQIYAHIQYECYQYYCITDVVFQTLFDMLAVNILSAGNHTCRIDSMIFTFVKPFHPASLLPPPATL